MLVGAIEALDIGDPFDYATDIGPVIDEESQDRLEGHKMRMQRDGARARRPHVARALPRGQLRDAGGLRDRSLERTRARGVRSDPARRTLRARPSRQGRSRRHQRLGLRPHAGSAQPHRDGGRLRRRATRASATSTSTATRSAPSSGRSRSAAKGCRGPGPKAGGPHTLAAYALERVRTTDITATGGNLQLLTRRGHRKLSRSD